MADAGPPDEELRGDIQDVQNAVIKDVADMSDSDSDDEDLEHVQVPANMVEGVLMSPVEVLSTPEQYAIAKANPGAAPKALIQKRLEVAKGGNGHSGLCQVAVPGCYGEERKQSGPQFPGPDGPARFPVPAWDRTNGTLKTLDSYRINSDARYQERRVE